MKKLNTAFTSLILLLLIILAAACNTDPEAPAVLQFVSSSGQNYVSENRNVAGGTPVITGVYAQAPTDNVTLSRFVVTFNHDSLDKKPPVTFLDSTLAPGTKTFSMPVAYTPRNRANKEIWKFIVTDTDGKEYKREIRIKTTSTVNTNASAFYTYADVLLSRVKDPRTTLDSLGFVGFASASGTSFPAYSVKQPEVTKQIDLFFNRTGTTKPSLSLAGLKGDSLRLTTLTSPEFDNINNVNALRLAYPVANPPYSTIENLQANQVLAFKTVANKVGLLRIDKVYQTLDSLTFDVKVEK